MTVCSFNIFIIFTIFLSFILHPSHGFEVIQPQNRTVNPDGSVTISCEHTESVSSVEDVRISVMSPGKRTVVCQKGMEDCGDIIMHLQSPNKCLFIILNIGPEDMAMKCQCEFTVKKKGLDYTMKGRPTILLPGQQEVVCVPPPPSPPPPPPPTLPPSPSQSHQLRWILIGLLALMFLYSCVITSFYIILRCSDRDPENSTYVEMRKVPLPRHAPFDIYRR